MERESAPGLGWVASGLAFVFAGVAFLFLVFTADLTLRAFGLLLTPAAGVAMAGVGLLVMIVHLVGQLLCLRVPPAAEARGPLVLAVVVNIVAKLVAVVMLLVSILRWWPENETLRPVAPLDPYFNWLSIASLGLTIAASLAFLAFLRRLARYVGDGSAEVDVEGLFVLWGACLLLWLLVQGFLETAWWLVNARDVWQVVSNPWGASALLVAFAALFALVLAVVALITFIKYCNLLTSLRSFILRQLEALAAETAQAKLGGLRRS